MNDNDSWFLSRPAFAYSLFALCPESHLQLLAPPPCPTLHVDLEWKEKPTCNKYNQSEKKIELNDEEQTRKERGNEWVCEPCGRRRTRGWIVFFLARCFFYRDPNTPLSIYELDDVWFLLEERFFCRSLFAKNLASFSLAFVLPTSLDRRCIMLQRVCYCFSGLCATTMKRSVYPFSPSTVLSIFVQHFREGQPKRLATTTNTTNITQHHT